MGDTTNGKKKVKCSTAGCDQEIEVSVQTAGTKLGNVCCTKCLERDRIARQLASERQEQYQFMAGF